MGISHHSDEYSHMKNDFIEEITNRNDWTGDYDETNDLVWKLFSIMNDYGAVDWT